MASINGWCGDQAVARQPHRILDLMIKKCGETVVTTYPDQTTDGSYLSINSGLYNTSFYQEGDFTAAIIGSPTWSDNSVSDCANTLGIAASLILAYKKFGVDLLTKIHGAFALAIIKGDSALIAVDRIGIHSMSYGMGDRTFVFSSSSLGVAAHPSINSSINSQGIFNYFYFYDIPSPGTIHTGVEKLLPAQYVKYVDGQTEKGFYWKLQYNDDHPVNFNEEKRTLDEILHASIKDAAVDGRTATFLSGGIDSSTVTGKLANISREKVNAYTIGFDVDEFDEMKYARLAANHFNVNINEYYIKPEDIIEAIPIIASCYDEPFGNESAVPAYFCAKKAAADDIQIMLGGDGGDEIFGGNERYAKQMMFEHYYKIPKFARNWLIEPVASAFKDSNSIKPIRKLQSYVRQANTPLPKRLEEYNFILRQPLQNIFSDNLLDNIDQELPGTMLDDAYFRANSNHPIQRMLHLDMKFTLADNDLRKVSRMCEAAGVEVRYPLLDERLVEFSGRLPAKYKVRQNMLRWFFKKAMKDFLPNEIIHKSKHGFGLPFGVWALTDPGLKQFVNETLDRFQDRNYLTPDYIRSIRQQHAEEHPTYYGKMIWLMVILEQWLEQYHAD